MKQKDVPYTCDTNIWYRLSDGTISSEEVAGKQLIGTFVSAYEFCCTHFAYSNYDKLRNAIITFKQSSKKIYSEDPTEYIKMISGHKSIVPKWAEISQMLDNVAKAESYLAPGGIRQRYLEYDDEIKELLKPFENLINEHRSKIKSRGIHKRMMNSPESRLTHKEITKELLTKLSGGLSLDWTRLELYVNTFDEWIRQLSIQSNLKMNANDWNDLQNLVYVQPGSLYWTCDNRKTKVFIENVGLGHYLYKAKCKADD